MDGDEVDDVPPGRRRRSHRLLSQNGANAGKKNVTEVEDDESETDLVDKPMNPKQVFKRQLDNSAAVDGGQDETPVDYSSQCKKTKKAQGLEDQNKIGLQKRTPAMTSVNPSSSSSSLENPVNDPTTCEIEQMQHIRSVMDELKNVPDITEIIKDSDPNQMPRNLDCSSSSAPAMVSEGLGGRFQTVNFYWLDLFEDPENPGVLFIFGKVRSPPPGNGYSSGCIVVKNLNRRVYLLPRETKADGTPVDYMDVYNEFYAVVAPQLKLPWFQCKRSKRKYCFDIEGIPPEAEYMEVRYSGTMPTLSQHVKGETFSHAFGTNASLIETFLLEKKLKGPSWLQLSYCERVQPNQQQSWSKFEFTCDVSSLKIHPDCSKFAVPTLVVASLQTETVYDSDLKRDVFIFAGVAVQGNFNLEFPTPVNEICHDFFCLINTPPGQTWPNGFERIMNKRLLKMDSESSMLECLVNKLHEVDADMYVDYGTDLNRLFKKLSDLKAPNRSRIGRLKRCTRAPFTDVNSHSAIPGRFLWDLAYSDMPQVITSRFAFNKKRNGKGEVASCSASTGIKALYKLSEDLESFVKWEMKHCAGKVRKINKSQVLPLAFQKSCIVGDTLARMLHWGSSHESEYLLLHALTAKDYIVPDDCLPHYNYFKKDAVDDRVLELSSRKAFHDNYVIQLDFGSGILHTFALQGFQFFLSNDADDGTEEPRKSIQNEFWKLEESRKQVEGLMRMKEVTEDQKRRFLVRLQALKTTNQDFRLDAFKDWRFSSKTLKAYAKAQIRGMLLRVKEIVRKMGYEVIYGSESSVMILSQSLEISAVSEIGKKIKEEIRRTYPVVSVYSYVNIYRFLLLFKDNQYAGLLHTPHKESKFEVDLEHFAVDPSGEMPSIVSKTARACLLEILSEQPLCDKSYKVGKILRDVGSQLREGALPLEELLIRKTLIKDPEEYENIQDLHHVTLALRMNKGKMLWIKFGKGDQVPYVLCTDGRPHHRIQMESEKDGKVNLRADPDYYLSQMIHPVLTDICEQIPGLGLDSAGVAHALGLGTGSSSWN